MQLVAVKIHNMPRINELLGVENGSLLLRKLSRFLQESADAWVFRMRGSCFVAIMWSDAGYRALIERLDRRIGEPWVVEGTAVLLHATVCRVSTEALLMAPTSPEETVNYLETAFLQSEHTGNRIVNIAAGAELLDAINRRRAVEEALRCALDGGEGLELYFQPIWSVREARFTSAEVLLRFRHPVMGWIPPDEFVPIAENNGFVLAMDEFVVRRACTFLRAEFPGLGLETLEINLSALEFMHHRLPELLSGIMAQHGADPRYLCFEVTETAATESFDLLQECMREINGFGCRFAVDDFGTGYANITQVIRLPFSVVKLDKSLLNGPPVVLEDLVRMFARMGRKTVIEGVEDAAQAALVQSYGVDYIQGYYYAKPMSEQDFLRFLREDGEGRRAFRPS